MLRLISLCAALVALAAVGAPGAAYAQQIPAGAIHDGRSGPQGAKVLATYVVEKGKPLATSAPYIKLPDLPATKPTP